MYSLNKSSFIMAPIPTVCINNMYNMKNYNNFNDTHNMHSRNISNSAMQDTSPCYENESILNRLERGGRVPSAEKFRRMVCFTHISCGGCPYGDKCVFLHDPRVVINGFKVRSTKQPRFSGAPKDTFYWPDMDKENVYNTVNFNGLPITGQNYSIPGAFSTNATYHDRAMYSLWENFIDLCSHSNTSTSMVNNTMDFKQALFAKNETRSPLVPIEITSNHSRVIKVKSDDPGNLESRYLPRRQRLQVFVDLATRNE